MQLKFLLVTAVLVLGGLGIPKVVDAYRGDPNLKGPNYSQERHTAMLKAFENQDYQAWKELMQDRGRITQVINQENFAEFAAAHQAGPEAMAKFRAEHNLGQGYGARNGGRMGQL